jgi:hypothetical protein
MIIIILIRSNEVYPCGKKLNKLEIAGGVVRVHKEQIFLKRKIFNQIILDN